MKNKIKIWLGLMCFLLLLTGINSAVYAVDGAELKAEMERAYQELKATNPKAAQEFIKEYQEAVKSGEITVETDKTLDRAGTEKMGDTAYDDNEPAERKERFIQMGNEFDKLLKEGKTFEEAEKIMQEKYGDFEEPDYDLSDPQQKELAKEEFREERKFLEGKIDSAQLDILEKAIADGKQELVEKMFDEIDKEMGYDEFDKYGPEDFDRYDGEMDYVDRDEYDFEHMSKEEMVEHFYDEMGREPDAKEMEMMERGDFEGIEREFDWEGPEIDRPEFDRSEVDHSGYERDEFDFERPDSHEGYERDELEFERPEFDRPEFDHEEKEEREREERSWSDERPEQYEYENPAL